MPEIQLNCSTSVWKDMSQVSCNDQSINMQWNKTTVYDYVRLCLHLWQWQRGELEKDITMKSGESESWFHIWADADQNDWLMVFKQDVGGLAINW